MSNRKNRRTDGKPADETMTNWEYILEHRISLDRAREMYGNSPCPRGKDSSNDSFEDWLGRYRDDIRPSLSEGDIFHFGHTGSDCFIVTSVDLEMMTYRIVSVHDYTEWMCGNRPDRGLYDFEDEYTISEVENDEEGFQIIGSVNRTMRYRKQEKSLA